MKWFWALSELLLGMLAIIAGYAWWIDPRAVVQFAGGIAGVCGGCTFLFGLARILGSRER